MIRLENLYSFMESSFDYLLVVDGEESIVHMNRLLMRDSRPENESTEGKHLNDILTPPSLTTFRSAMAQARGKNRANAVYTVAGENSRSIPLKAGHGDTDGGEIFVFFGNKLETLRKLQEWEKNERIKELSCLYDIAEWIEDSDSISEFFTELPRYLASGMLYPEEAIVYSTYQGIEYGQKPNSYNYISVRLIVGGADKGEIRVGYYSEKRQLLPEEQRMLDEIGRMLSLALERKELKERLIKKQSEEADFNKRLDELQHEIAKRTTELEEQNNKLRVVNSYLDTAKGGWEEIDARGDVQSDSGRGGSHRQPPQGHHVESRERESRHVLLHERFRARAPLRGLPPRAHPPRQDTRHPPVEARQPGSPGPRAPDLQPGARG
jgi:hypothetical protein